MAEMTDWPKAVAVLGGVLFGMFVLSLLMPIPWLLLAHWLEERMKIKATFAQARLQEAQNAARKLSEAGGRSDER